MSGPPSQPLTYSGIDVTGSVLVPMRQSAPAAASTAR
ncbi:MAG: hypothetical protein JWL84_648 [Rhodospirillales bacterium]|nr:hypothetical protein [Rhodospirillales bacterium]